MSAGSWIALKVVSARIDHRLSPVAGDLKSVIDLGCDLRDDQRLHAVLANQSFALNKTDAEFNRKAVDPHFMIAIEASATPGLSDLQLRFVAPQLHINLGLKVGALAFERLLGQFTGHDTKKEVLLFVDGLAEKFDPTKTLRFTVSDFLLREYVKG